jgi:hypothetical protein
LLSLSVLFTAFVSAVSAVLLLLELILFDLIDSLLCHMFLVVHRVEEDATLLQLLLHILPVYEHEVTQQFILVLIHLSCHWEDQT